MKSLSETKFFLQEKTFLIVPMYTKEKAQKKIEAFNLWFSVFSLEEVILRERLVPSKQLICYEMTRRIRVS